MTSEQLSEYERLFEEAEGGGDSEHARFMLWMDEHRHEIRAALADHERQSRTASAPSGTPDAPTAESSPCRSSDRARPSVADVGSPLQVGMIIEARAWMEVADKLAIALTMRHRQQAYPEPAYMMEALDDYHNQLSQTALERRKWTPIFRDDSGKSLNAVRSA